MSTNALVPFTFNSIKLFTVTINGKHWSRAKEICDALEYKRRTNDILRDHVSIENKHHRHDLDGYSDTEYPFVWPKHSQPDEYYINEEGLYELVFTSQQPKAKLFRKYCCNIMFPNIRQKLVDIDLESSNRQHQLAIEEKDHQHQLAIEDMGREHQQVMEEKDDEIQNLVRNRHVPRIGKHDNIVCAIQKNEPDELGKPGRHPYYMIRCQRMRLQQRLHIKQLQYPNMVIKRPTYDAANAVICWVEFQKYIGKDSYYRNHFSLDNDDHRDFFANTFDIDM